MSQGSLSNNTWVWLVIPSSSESGIQYSLVTSHQDLNSLGGHAIISFEEKELLIQQYQT